MDVKTSIREDGATQVTVTVPAETVKQHIKDHYKELGRARIPGFRPGKAPRPILDQNFGGHEAVFAEITQEIVNDAAPKAVDSQNVMFIKQAEFEQVDEEVVEGKDYTFAVYGPVKPEVELSSYDAVEIELPPEKATEEEINQQIETMREYYYSFETVETAAAEGDFVQLSMKVTTPAGEEVQGLNSPSRLLEIGAGSVPATFEAEVIGLKAGDTKSFDFDIKDNDSFSYVGEDTLHAEVEISEVRTKVVPEIGPELAKKMGMETMEELREKMEEAINNQKDQQIPALKEQRCVTALGERVNAEDISEDYINFTRQDIAREFFNNLQQQNVTMDQFLQQQGITMEQFNEDLEEESKEVAAQTLALDAVCRKQGIECTEEDLTEEFSVVDDPEGTRKNWEENGRMSELREAVCRRKATEWAIENAVVTTVEDKGEDSEEA